MRIALDVMGGDHAPQVTIQGAIEAARSLGCSVALVGPKAQIEAALARYDTQGLDLPIIDAPDTIEMDEQPAQAVRRKPNSSHVVGLKLVREKKADAFVSAGHSGASIAAALFVLGRIRGIDRPALGGIMPTLAGKVLALDMGAITDCKPEYLLQFAQMGSAYAQKVMGITEPRIGLLSNGEEASKGDQLVKQAHPLLATDPSIHFVGNVEPKDFFTRNACDVVVADGFVGNLVLKTGEAVVSFAAKLLTREAKRSLLPSLALGFVPIGLVGLFARAGRKNLLLGALLGALALLGSVALPLLKVWRTTDYRVYGGAPLLGVKGIVIVAHGKSDAVAVMNAIRQAKQTAESGVLDSISAMSKQQEVASSNGNHA